jgi:chlorobactene glucosyltransferase
LLSLPWFLPFLTLFRLARKTPNLRQVPPAENHLVSVIVPARNEARTIRTVVDSILESGYPRFELLVVDDRSVDETAALVEQRAATDPRLRLIRGQELPAGWYGKPWACWQGYRAARGDVLVFTDADTRHAPELLGRTVGALEASGAALVTVAPRQRCVTLWERLVMPQIWVLLGLRYHPERVNHARHARDVIANGQFIMMPREAYEAIGTHQAVRAEVVEDLALAQQTWRTGRKLHFAFAEHYMETRMYTGLRELIEGWSKNIYLGGQRSLPDEPVLRALVPVALAAVELFWLLPPVVLLLGVLGAADGRLLDAARIATAASLGFWSLISIGMQVPVWYALGYPVGVMMTLYITARSSLRGRRRVEWKGRTYGKSVNTG